MILSLMLSSCRKRGKCVITVVVSLSSPETGSNVMILGSIPSTVFTFHTTFTDKNIVFGNSSKNNNCRIVQRVIVLSVLKLTPRFPISSLNIQNTHQIINRIDEAVM